MSTATTRMRASRYEDLAAVEIEHADVLMTIVHEIGPRIVAFHHVGGDNLLYWDTAGAHCHNELRMYRGHRLWTTRPDADESEETFAPDNTACIVRQIGDCVEVTSPPTSARIEKTMSVTVADGVWTIEHRLRNTGTLLWAGGAWALTCTRPGPMTSYGIPLGGGSPTWDVLTLAIPRRWAGHTSRLDDPQFVFDDSFSSDLVFDGDKTSPYEEHDAAVPLGVYGRTKLEAEQRILAACPTALVIRTSAFFGPWDRHNFVSHVLGELKERRDPCRG